MAVEHVGIVWNPSKADRATIAAALEHGVTTAGIDPEITWEETSEQDPGLAATERALAAGADLVIAAGGDGTVRAVVEHLAAASAEAGRAPAELGIAPLGTGNLLARNLGVPLNDLAAAFERALTGTARPIDVGWAELELDGESERLAFAVMAGFGIDAHMIVETDDGLKERIGWLAYVESLGRAVAASEVIAMSLAVDGRPAIDAEAHTLLIGNCRTLQGGVTLLPDADPSDGRLDLLLLDADGLGGWLDTMRNMVWDNGIRRLFARGDATAQSSDSATHRQLERIRIELQEPRVFEIDGEDLGETSRIDISVQAGAVRVR